jgi:alpha-maltose-1-phosphate synthase
LVAPQNVEQLKAALLRLVNNPEERRLMGETGKQRVRDYFSMDNMIRQYDRILSELLR